MNKDYKLKPNWITGLVDAEGCFYVRFAKSKQYKTGWLVQPCFQLGFHIKDKELLLKVKSFFNNVGSIYPINKNKALLYQVRNLKDINEIIIPHFEQYPLITQKKNDFILFKEIVKLMNKDEHLKKNSLIKIINLKASLNRGLSDKLLFNYPEMVKVQKSKVSVPVSIDHNWFAGFFSGEGCFSIAISKSNKSKVGYAVGLRIIVGQHSRDKLLINSFINILGYGYTLEEKKKFFCRFYVAKFEDVYYKVIPLFKKHEIRGIKSLDFKNFCEIAELVNNKAHLTPSGLEQIKKN